MRRILFLMLVFSLLIYPVGAETFTAPMAPEQAQKYMPKDTETFSEGLCQILKTALAELKPCIVEAGRSCACVVAVVLLMSLLSAFYGKAKAATDLAAAVTIGLALFQPSGALIRLGMGVVTQLSEYGKLLLPVMTAAMASHGGVSTSTALYTATAIFSSILTTLIVKIIVPLLYVFLCLAVVNCAVDDDMLKNLQGLIKRTATWCLKTVLYVFTGYISITGVISGSADAAAVKATKLAISGAVPVVGGILSDASETILISAGIMKSAAGVYGLLALISLWIGPFVRIGVQYLLINLTGGISGIFADKKIASLVQDFSTAMSMLLAMTGAICLLLLISTICFMKGVSI